MSARASFKQSEVERACRALMAVGKDIGAVESRPEGGFRVLTKDELAQEARDPLKAWEREHGDRAA